MADLATLGLAIDSRPAVDAATALGNFREAAGGAQTAAQALQATAARAGGALAQATSGAREAATAHRDLASQITAAGTNLGTYVTRQGDATRAVNDTTAAIVRQAAGWRALGEAGRQAVQMYDRNAEAARRLGSLSSAGGVPQAAPQGAGAVGGRLNAQGLQNLFYQGSDVLASAASGASLMTIALQQGGQIAPTFMGPGGASLRGIASQAGEALGGLAARIGVAGGALGGLTLAVGAAAAAALSYRSAQSALQLQLAGVGRASGTTAAGIGADAALNAGAAGLSQREYREAAGTFAATGRIGQEMYAGLIKSAKDYAYTTGQDVPDAIKGLASAFADPAKGAESLNERLGFLNDTTLESIQRLQAQGDRLGAQRALMDSYSTSLLKAKDTTSAWGQTTTAVGNAIANAWDYIGAAVNRSFTGGNTLEEQLATARDLLSGAQSFQGGIVDRMFGNSSAEVQRLQDVVAAIEQMIAARDKANQQTAANQNSRVIGDLVRSFNPTQQELKKTQDAAEQLRKAISDPVKWGLDQTQLAATEQTFERISRLARTMADDISRFGDATVAASVRQAQFENRTVGFSPVALGVAQNQQRYVDELRAKGIDPNGPSSAQVRADYDNRIANADSRDIAGLTAAAKAAVENAVTREGLAETLKIRTDTALKETVRRGQLGETRYSTSLAQVPDAYRKAIFDNATRVGEDPNFIASILKQESGFNPRVVSRAGAQGIAQFMPDTARGVGLADPFDPIASIEKMVEHVADLRRKYGTDELVLSGYNRGEPNTDKWLKRGGLVSGMPDETRNYIAKITTRPPNLDDQLKAERERTATLDTQKRAVQDNTDLLGRDAVALEARRLADEELQRALLRGTPITDDFRAAVQKNAQEMAETNRRLANSRFGADLRFEREQLGRTDSDQALYSRVRGAYGDVSSPAAQAALATADLNDNLKQTKDLTKDAFGGFASDLLRGASAANALQNQLARVIDRLTNKAIDSLVSGLFDSKSGVGGGIGSLFSGAAKAFGFDVGGYTGPGGRYQPAGIVHRGEVVWSQDDVARAGGPAIVDAMRRGGRGYADGGYVGPGDYPMPARPAANSNGGPAMPTINFITPPGTNLEADGPPQRRADGSYDQALRAVESGIANRARNGRGPLQQAAGGAWARTG